jgi:hypothetical protein
MFVLMDDVGAFIWRFGKRLLASHGESEHPSAGHADDRGDTDRREPPPPPSIVHSPAAE